MKCKECSNYCGEKRLPDYQATFHNWCELYQTPSALIRNCDFAPISMKNLPKTKVESRLDEFFNIFAKKPTQTPPFLK